MATRPRLPRIWLDALFSLETISWHGLCAPFRFAAHGARNQVFVVPASQWRGDSETGERQREKERGGRERHGKRGTVKGREER